MLFSSYEFLLFLLIVFTLYYLIPKNGSGNFYFWQAMCFILQRGRLTFST